MNFEIHYQVCNGPIHLFKICCIIICKVFPTRNSIDILVHSERINKLSNDQKIITKTSKMESCNSRQSVCTVRGLKSQFQARESVPFSEQITIPSNDFALAEEPAESNLLANRSTV